MNVQKLVRRNAFLVKPETRTAMEMADQDLYIFGGGGAIKYYSDFAPYMNRPLKIMTSRAHLECIIVGSSRSAKTKTILEAYLNWMIRCAAGNAFIYCSTQTKAEEFGKVDIDTAVFNTPALEDLAVVSKTTWTITTKTFKTCKVFLGSATTSTTSASGYKTVICTDYDRAADDIGQEGNKFELMAGRTTNLGSAGMAAAESSPARQVRRLPKNMGKHDHPVPDTDQGIAGLYNMGTQERFYWCCTGCGKHFIPEFELISWIDKGSIAETALTAVMTCPHCGSCYTNADKDDMNMRAINYGLDGYFQAHQIDPDGTFNGKPYNHKSRGSIWFEGTVIRARTWSRLVEKYLTALEEYERYGNESALKAFNNTYLGRNYLLQCGIEEDIEVSWLIERARHQNESYPYTHGIVPADCSYLIMTVDIQNGKNARFVCQANAFTPDGLKMYVVDRFEIIQDQNGDRVNPAREVDSWKLLIDHCIKKTYPVQGTEYTMRPIKTVADMGGTNVKAKQISTSTTEIAYQFVKYLDEQKLKPLFELSKGANRSTTMDGLYRYSDNEKSGHKDACPYIEMNTHMLANMIRTSITKKGNEGLMIVLPYWMVGTKKADWFDEIISEEQDSHGLWECPAGVRNEAVDLTKMALACSFWLADDTNKDDHTLPLDENPYVQLEQDHVFGVPVKMATVAVSDAAQDIFNNLGGW